jgi:hypothetical protein
MNKDQKNNQPENKEEDKLPVANTGNASNPSAPDREPLTGSDQLLDEKAEKYLRESANIEDYPDAEDK